VAATSFEAPGQLVNLVEPLHDFGFDGLGLVDQVPQPSLFLGEQIGADLVLLVQAEQLSSLPFEVSHDRLRVAWSGNKRRQAPGVCGAT
jgi:hypothetical protein